MKLQMVCKGVKLKYFIKNLRITIKVVFRGKCMDFNAFIIKEERPRREKGEKRNWIPSKSFLNLKNY